MPLLIPTRSAVAFNAGYKVHSRLRSRLHCITIRRRCAVHCAGNDGGARRLTGLSLSPHYQMSFFMVLSRRKAWDLNGVPKKVVKCSAWFVFVPSARGARALGPQNAYRSTSAMHTTR
ncbi:hypothetical protein EVAR_81613_1 [Eumeta japonica]|uniref:Uncharacterized protein n=1 Tax=Eumeta variegata TaxID=151549 RepID=A0A4C1WDC8_EUMVA|nr:hypothetical protein EVAR_81613_1 [Eumeta japonica]